MGDGDELVELVEFKLAKLDTLVLLRAPSAVYAGSLVRSGDVGPSGCCMLEGLSDAMAGFEGDMLDLLACAASPAHTASAVAALLPDLHLDASTLVSWATAVE